MHLLVLNKRTISCQMVFDLVNCCWIDCLDFAGTLLSKHIYEHLTTAAGLTLLYTWVFILLSSKKLSKPSTRQTCETVLALLLIGAAVTGTLTEASGRPGFL